MQRILDFTLPLTRTLHMVDQRWRWYLLRRTDLLRDLRDSVHAVETQEVKEYGQKHKAITSIPVFSFIMWASIFHPQCFTYVSFSPFSLSCYNAQDSSAVCIITRFVVGWEQCSSFRAGLEDMLDSGDRSQHLAMFRDTSYSILRSCSLQILILFYITGRCHTFSWHLYSLFFSCKPVQVSKPAFRKFYTDKFYYQEVLLPFTVWQ